MRWGFRTLCLAAMFAGQALPVCADAFDIARLIRNERPAAKDAAGWASDMRAAFDDIGIPPTRENVCAGIAIISQESGFSANPAVPDLGRISEASLRARLGAIPVLGATVLAYLERTPQPEGSFMDRIRAARTERDLDLVYRALVDELASRTDLKWIVESGVLNRFIEQRNDISTIGSMQVSVAFALKTARQQRWTPMTLQDSYRVRDELYTRRGGMRYGLLQLLGYDTGYDRKVYRFADYNAGRYASRNAAFQLAVSEVGGVTLARDGDLLAYGANGKPAATPGNTEKALRHIARTQGLGLSSEELRRDLLREKKADFATTRLFGAIRDLYQKKTGKLPPFAAIPDIALKSEKISSRMTTRIFAERVNGRYRRCMTVK